MGMPSRNGALCKPEARKRSSINWLTRLRPRQPDRVVRFLESSLERQEIHGVGALSDQQTFGQPHAELPMRPLDEPRLPWRAIL
jgi:hypothetical protein